MISLMASRSLYIFTYDPLVLLIDLVNTRQKVCPCQFWVEVKFDIQFSVGCVGIYQHKTMVRFSVCAGNSSIICSHLLLLLILTFAKAATRKINQVPAEQFGLPVCFISYGTFDAEMIDHLCFSCDAEVLAAYHFRRAYLWVKICQHCFCQ